jgi:hypothetical protein
LDQFSPRQSRPHFKIASIAAAGASQFMCVLDSA